jgi:hypothetical protein
MKRLRILVFVVLAATLAGSAQVSRTEADEGWIALFDGQDLFGWSSVGGASWSVAGGALSPGGATSGYLRSNSAFADFDLKFDFRNADATSNAALLLRISKDGDPHKTGYVLAVGDGDSVWPAGSIVEHFRAQAVHPSLNQWHTAEVQASGDHVLVKIDGAKVTEGKSLSSRAGYLALACDRGCKTQFRNLKLKPTGLQALFNGTDLNGWKSVGTQPPPPKKGMLKMFKGGGKQKEAEWSVVGNTIHADKGPGQLESQTMYDDFVLQLAIRVNAAKKGEHPKAGVLFRGDPGQLFSGYEVRVRNEYQHGDRSQVVDYGTGGIADVQPARRVMADDNEFFTETIVTTGRHVQVWVNGFPVTDFYDTRPESSAAHKFARTGAGTISLAAPTEQSNLDFRNIHIAALPKTFGRSATPAVAAAPIPVPAAAPAGVQQIVIPGQAEAQARQAKESALMAQALKTSDPDQQVAIYDQILQLNPSNSVAFTGRQQAQQKIDQARAERERQQAEAEQQTKSQSERETNGNAALQNAESEFFAGKLKLAGSHLAIAEKLIPENPRVQQLRTRLDQVLSARRRTQGLLIGGGAAALLLIIAALLISARKKDAYLEIIDGFEKGKRFPLDQEVVHIGAVAQDGGVKNEIVVRDMSRLVSRFHCEIHRDKGHYYLIDCNSANGTKVDRERVRPGKPIRLKSGARIELAGISTMQLGWQRSKNQQKS